MARTVKEKIRLGTLFLFALLLLSGGVSMYHLVRLRNDAKIILEDNYESLIYCNQMQNALDSLAVDRPHMLARFAGLLSLQEANITEAGEVDYTKAIRSHFNRYISGDSSANTLLNIKTNIRQVLALNMRGINIKNHNATITANHALTYISLLVAIIFLAGLTFSYNFPSVITDPINAFIIGIRQVAEKNYRHRIRLDRTDEFGEMANAFNGMAERLEYFESSNLNKIIFEKTRAEAVINSLKDASIGIDKNSMVLFANDQALQLLGVKSGDIVNKPVGEVGKVNELFRFLIEEKNTVPFKIVVDNHENYFVKEITDINQDIPGSKVIVLKNITSFKELDVAKTNFIATISHELKTPLASSDLSLKLLEDERVSKLSDEQKELINNLKQDNRRMLRILSELLNMSQVETGKIQLDLTSIDPVVIAEHVIQAMAGIAREKKISIERKFEKDIVNITADGEKTEWVLNNFLANAIRYSPEEGAIGISIKKVGPAIEFSVADQGPGIPSEYIEKVFDRFFKVPGSKAGGTGLGLSISKEFIEAQRGNIGVASEVGVGTVFTFTLPLSDLLGTAISK